MKLKKSGKWSRLDNAAKIFPPTTTKRDTKVFRFACALREPVNCEILQTALEKAMQVFPAYRSILKCGLFWYYLEESAIESVVREEYRPPCSSLYNKNVKSLLFEVTYFKNRINVETYHALTDGTGALHFLRVLVFHYLTLRYAERFVENPPVLDYDASSTERMKDSFQKYYSHKKKHKQKEKMAYKVKGARVPEQRITIIEGVIPLQKLLSKAKEYHTTLTILCAALLICSIRKEMAVRALKHPVVISVPINLRKYFPSGSARNFFSVMRVSYAKDDGDGSVESIIEKISGYFQSQLAPEELEGNINQFTSLEKNVFARMLPLIFKDPCMRIAYEISAMEETAAISNMGALNMPAELCGYIDMFDVFVSANKPQVCMCSFEDKLTISFTSPFVATDVQQHFFRAITQMGIEVQIAANQIDDE